MLAWTVDHSETSHLALQSVAEPQPSALGKLVAVGHAAHEAEQFPWGAFQGSGPKHNRSITTFLLGSEGDLSHDMTWLALETSHGRLETGPLSVSAWHDLVDTMATANTDGTKRVYTIGT